MRNKQLDGKYNSNNLKILKAKCGKLLKSPLYELVIGMFCFFNLLSEYFLSETYFSPDYHENHTAKGIHSNWLIY